MNLEDREEKGLKTERMKRGKDEKIKGPMFPRLHVNDTEKKGPRAPPRNKMALYEQFSIPSQRFNHSSNKPAEPPSNQVIFLSSEFSPFAYDFCILLLFGFD